MPIETVMGTVLYPAGKVVNLNGPRFDLTKIEGGFLEDLLGLVDTYFRCTDPLVLGRRFFVLEEPSYEIQELARSRGLTTSYMRFEWSPLSLLGWQLELRAQVDKPLSESVPKVLATI